MYIILKNSRQQLEWCPDILDDITHPLRGDRNKSQNVFVFLRRTLQHVYGEKKERKKHNCVSSDRESREFFNRAIVRTTCNIKDVYYSGGGVKNVYGRYYLLKNRNSPLLTLIDGGARFVTPISRHGSRRRRIVVLLARVKQINARDEEKKESLFGVYVYRSRWQRQRRGGVVIVGPLCFIQQNTKYKKKQ